LGPSIALDGTEPEGTLSERGEKPERKDLVLRAQAPLVRRDPAWESEYQGLWFTLGRVPWRTLVLVPAGEGESAAGVAAALASVGRQFRQAPVTFLVVSGPIDYSSAGKFVSAVAGRTAQPDDPPSSRVIVAVPPVVADPLALAVTDSADAVVICVRAGATHLAAADRTIEMIGRDRIVGCVML
jgi:hypothetical protein